MTLNSTLLALTQLALSTHADYQFTTQVERKGVWLIVHWLGTEDKAIPREAHLFFRPDDHPDGSLLMGVVYDPGRYLAATEEGLDDTDATEASRAFIESVEAAMAYLQARPYAVIHRQGAALRA